MIAVQQSVHVESLLYDLLYDLYDFHRELIFSSLASIAWFRLKNDQHSRQRRSQNNRGNIIIAACWIIVSANIRSNVAYYASLLTASLVFGSRFPTLGLGLECN